MKSIHSIRTYNAAPNFSIVVPGGCNAHCKFCFWQSEAAHPKYLSRLKQLLAVLPPKFQSLSITGAEPTKMLDDLVRILHQTTTGQFKKVVLSTNGLNLQTLLDKSQNLNRAIQHINISRHHWDEATNLSIFGAKNLPSNSDLEQICLMANFAGIDITFSAVLTEHLANDRDINAFIRFARNCGASGVFFRKQHGDLTPSTAEQNFAGFAKRESSCPVCRASSMLIQGMPVTWKASVSEPDQVIQNKVYELVFHPSGVLSSDWGKKNPIDYLSSKARAKRRKVTPRSSIIPACGGTTCFIGGHC